MEHEKITPTVAKTIRNAYGFNQTQMADHLGTSFTTYSHFEGGYSKGEKVKQLIIENVHFSIIARAIEMVNTTAI